MTMTCRWRCVAAFVVSCTAVPASALVLDGCPDGDLAGTAQALGSYNAYMEGEGFVIYDAMELATERWLSILEYCPDRRQVVLVTGHGFESTDVEDAARQLFDEMIRGDQSFTMSQMVTALRSMGAEVEDRNVTYQSCGCALHFGGGQ